MLKKLKECLKNRIKDSSIFDIVVYGSSVKGKPKPHDVDVAIIFKRGTLKERLGKLQEIKRKIKLNEKIDFKTILLEELFKEEFFGRSGLFLEGVSLIDDQPFSQKIGFDGFTIFVYELRNKTHVEKVKFNYLLSGRGNRGIVKKLGGKHVSSGVIQIPIRNSLEFEEVLKTNRIGYQKKNALIEK